MNKYKAFYKNKTIEVDAETSFGAQEKAAEIFKAKRSYDVSVFLIQKNNKEVVHNPMF